MSIKKLHLKNSIFSGVSFGLIACLLSQISLPSYGGSVVAPSNDIYADADEITGESGTVAGNNFHATAELDDPTDGAKSIWWKWTAPSDGTFAFDTFGSEADTVMAVGTGDTIGEFNQIDFGDDAGRSQQSRVVFEATQGTIYYIVVDNFFGGDFTPGGPVTLNWTLIPPLTLPVMVYNFRQVVSVRGQANDEGGLVFDNEGNPVWGRTQTFTESGILIRGRKDGASLDDEFEVGPTAAIFLSSSREGRVTTRFYEKFVSEDNASGTFEGRVVQYSSRNFEESIFAELEVYDSVDDDFFEVFSQEGIGAASLKALYRGGPKVHYATKLTGNYSETFPYTVATVQGVPLRGLSFKQTDTLLYNSGLSARVKDAATFQEAVDAIIEFLESRAGGNHVPVP